MCWLHMWAGLAGAGGMTAKPALPDSERLNRRRS